MQLVRKLALVAAVCCARAVAQDTTSPSPPAATSAPSPAPATPPPANPTAPSTPPPGATPAPSTSTPSTGSAGPVATKSVDADGFTRVQINPQLENTELRMEATETTVVTTGTSDAGAFSTPSAENMRVLVDGVTARLEVLTLSSRIVKALEIGSYGANRTTRMSLTGNGFANLTSLSSLSFQNINFNKEIVTLPVPETLAYLKIDRSNVADMSLSTPTDASNLNQVEFINSGFTSLPFLLYQRKYPSPLKLNGNFSMTDDFTPLSQDEYANAEHNLADADAAFISFQPSCTATNHSESIVVSRHVICNDATRTGIRTLGTSNVRPGASATSAPSSSSSTERSSDSNSNTTLTVIVIVIAVIAAVLAYFVARRYFCTSSTSARSPRLNERTVGLISKDDPPSTTNANGHNKLSFISSDDALRQIRLDQQDVSITKSVGTGRLWIGDFAGRKVMIKRIEAESSDSYATKALITQARSLAPLRHPNIVSLLGVTWVQGTDFGVVGEFMEKGTLKAVLMDIDSELDLQSKLHMCLDIALALQHLHSSECNLFMRRLTSRKVLVNGAIECKLNLFECHPSTSKIDYPEVFGVGDMAWEAPELITRTGVLDPRKINIFALGVLIGEIMTRVSPYQSAIDAVGHTLADLDLVKRIRRQERLMPHENRREFTELPAPLRDMVERCLSYQPLARPTAAEVAQCLESVKDYSERVGSTTSL